MVASTLEARQSTRCDIATEDLVLRICGPSRNGQIVRLKSAKCTVGSGPRCTLRLRARGVAPLHCLILRGPKGTIVRRWTADTRLNYQSFTDAALSPGDRLSIGPIELEVLSPGISVTSVDQPSEAALETGQNALAEERRQWEAQQNEHTLQAAAQAEQQLQARLADLDADRQALDHQRQEWRAEQNTAQERLNEQEQQLAARLAELETGQNALAEERRQWEAQQNEHTLQAAAQAEQQLQARLADLDADHQALDHQRQEWRAEQNTAQERLNEQEQQLAARLAELETGQNALAEERRQWEAQQNEHTLQAAAQAEQQLQARLADLDADRQALDHQRQEWRAEQNTAQERLNEQEQQLAARLAELETGQNALAEERRQWEAQQNEHTLQAAAQAEQQLQARLADLDADHQALDHQRQEWRAEQNTAQERLNEQEQQLAARLAELETGQNALAEERRQWEAQQNEHTLQAAAQAEQQLQARLADLDADRQALDHQRQEWRAEQNTAQERLNEQEQQLAARLAELETRQNALAEERRQWEQQRADAPCIDDQPATPSGPAVGSEEPQAAQSEELQFQTPTEQSPVDLADVFRRIGANIKLDDEEPAADAPASPIKRPLDTAGQSSPASSEKPATEEREEESIDQYMSRLMQRIRSADGEPAAPSSAPRRPESKKRRASDLFDHACRRVGDDIAADSPARRVGCHAASRRCPGKTH